MEAEAKAELNKKAHSAVILCLGNKVLREVTGETTAAGVWTKLETLYMTKSLANKLYLKKKLYTFYMPAGRKISEHIDDIIRTLCGYLALWNGKALTLEDVMATLNSKEIKERSKAKGDDGEGLYVRGRTDRRDSHQSRGKSRSKSRGGRLKCYICQSEDHLKRNCPKNNRKKSTELDIAGNDLKRGYTVKMQSGKIKVINGSRVILSGIRKDNCVYSLDGHAMAGELNASVEEKDSLAQFGTKDWDRERAGNYRCWKSKGLENQSGRTIKKLRTNNGLEFCNWMFEQLCIESEIARHLTVAGTLQQNRPSERKRSVAAFLIIDRSEDGDDEDARDHETDQTPDLTDYQLAQDRERRTRTKPLRFRDESNMAAYAFVAAEEEDTHEPLTYQEAVACEDSSKWKATMEEEMDSLRKNKT
ncbi:retrovirus-related pol polyprotein from transposon TNT 1-94 [Tanacetum coccineum]